jgi:hypothetical protein
MAHRQGQYPQHMLQGGSRVIHDEGKERVFTIRKVFYDDTMTPLYTRPEFTECLYSSLQELKKDHPHNIIWESPILDKDFYLKVWNSEEELIPLE